MPLTRYPIEIIQINNIIKGSNYDKIILNIKNELITSINGKNYILVKKNNNIKSLYDEIKNSKVVFLPHDSIDSIIKTNWDILWSKKIDYIEYQLQSIDNNIISNSVWYYIGMAENAISYINDTIETDNKNHNLYISHKRINEKFFNNPLNIIVDYKSRDIAEYLKYIFIKKKYDYVEISHDLKNLDLDYFSCRMIYGRLFFVTFYFDLFDVNDNDENISLLKDIINRVDEYEDYINNIYEILNQIKKIPKIDWV